MISRRTILGGMALSLPSALLWRPDVGIAKAHYRLPLGLNLSGMSYWADEQPFTNLAFNASRWRVQVKDAPFTWDEPLPPLTEDGYPLFVPVNAWLDTFLMFTPHRDHLSAELYVHYEGRGRMTYVGGGELIERLPGRDRIRDLHNGEPVTLRLIETDADDPLRNIRLTEQDPPSAAPFRADFLARLREMSALRFMDWMATNNSDLAHWEDRPRLGTFGRSESGVPLELMTSLSNTVKIAPWFNIPHQADDAFVSAFAAQVLRDLDPTLPVYVEYSNETWNMIFDQADHCGRQGLALSLSSDGFEAQLRYYALRTDQILKIWRNVFGTEAKRVVGVFAAQAENPWTSETILGAREGSGFSDVLAVAPYFGGSLGDPERAEVVRDWTLDRLFDELNHQVATDNRARMRDQSALARQHGLPLYAYEGGQHLVGFGGAENDEQLTALFIAANRDLRMGVLYDKHLSAWRTEGGALYALFASMGGPSKWGSWGLVENESSGGVKWEAVQRSLRR